jgi:hydrocephalus-inducing protein
MRPRYTMALTGRGHKPKLDLSFMSHDFGVCHVHQHGMAPNTAVLRARNDDTQDISFDFVYDNKEHLQVDCGPTVLAPGQQKEIAITFRPQVIPPPSTGPAPVDVCYLFGEVLGHRPPGLLLVACPHIV